MTRGIQAREQGEDEGNRNEKSQAVRYNARHYNEGHPCFSVLCYFDAYRSFDEAFQEGSAGQEDQKKRKDLLDKETKRGGNKGEF